MERVQLTEKDRRTLINAAAFGFRTTAATELTPENTDALASAMVEAREHLATTSDDCAYIIIRVEAA